MLRLVFAICLTPMTAFAQEVASAAAIKAAIIGNTVNGNMSASGGYAEFYASNGQIKAADYEGTWSLQGDKMCFAYGEDPPGCWAVSIAGSSVTWLSDAGVEGTGSIVAGNPNGW